MWAGKEEKKMARMEYAGGNDVVETRNIAANMQRQGCPRNIALRAQAHAEVREELGSKVDADTLNRLGEQRYEILRGETR